MIVETRPHQDTHVRGGRKGVAAFFPQFASCRSLAARACSSASPTRRSSTCAPPASSERSCSPARRTSCPSTSGVGGPPAAPGWRCSAPTAMSSRATPGTRRRTRLGRATSSEGRTCGSDTASPSPRCPRTCSNPRPRVLASFGRVLAFWLQRRRFPRRICGEGGIRTRGRLLTDARLASGYLRPLGHLS